MASLIVVLRGAKDIENEGRILCISNNVKTDFLLKQIAEKLSILGGCQDIQVFDENNRVLVTVDQIKQQKVIFVDLKHGVKTYIPGPRGLPFVGALYELLPDMIQGWANLFNKYGPLLKFYVMGRQVIGTNSPDIAAIFVKEDDHFTKKVGNAGGLLEVKAIGGQGLFTTDTDEMDWKLAHKLLMPAFSPRAIKVYQKEMGIITQQAISVLEQYMPDEPVEILDWATNITFETIGRIGFGYEFNLLCSRDQPQNDFIDAMGYCLNESLKRMMQAQFMKKLPLESNRKFDRSMQLMHDIVDSVIAQRKCSPEALDMDKDLLGFMLNARDEHQLGLSDENIRDQVVTFLIAGHDTTANTIAWCLYQLSKNPDIQAKVLQEIADNHITAEELPSSEQINNLKYLHQALKETLRLYAPLRALTKHCKADCIVPGGYVIKGGEQVTIQLHALHHNPDVYPDPYRFDPDRWTPEEEQKRSRFAWLPFSTGPRGCIGMAFALQEAKTVLSMLLHRFDFRYDGPEIKIHPKMATTKPMDLFMTIHPRENFPQPHAKAAAPVAPKKPAPSNTVAPTIPAASTSVPPTTDIELPPITFLYGTQTGTAQDYANQLAKQAKNFGFKKTTLCEMDRWSVLQDDTQFLTSDQSKKRTDKALVVICTATYNGQPPDSADKFNKFLDLKMNNDGHSGLLKGLSFAVFGLGNKNWRTYQQFPRKVAECLEEFGATRFFSSGEGDADQDMDLQFNEWCAHFWAYTLDHYRIVASESKSVVPASATTEDRESVKVRYIPPADSEAWVVSKNNCHGDFNATIHVNYELQTKLSQRSTRHIEIDISQLSPVAGETMLYSVGDHLELLPENRAKDVESIALGFGLVLDSVFEIDEASIADVSPRSLAAHIKGPCSVRNMLTYYADITSPPSRAMLGYFASQLKAVSPATASAFQKLIMPDEHNKDAYPAFIQIHRTLMDLQKSYPQVNRLDLGQFLATVSVIQPRRYSIASSPLVDPVSAHLAVSVVDDVVHGAHYPGLASSFLQRSVIEGTKLRASLKSSKDTFSLPQNITTPLIIISAGTGFAPFRGFLQERRAQLEAGQRIGDAVLFFGCRHKDQDFIYQEEIEEYQEAGVLTDVHVAFSRNAEGSPVRYVQHQLLAHAAKVWRMICPSPGDSGVVPASVYVCGSGAMSHDVRLTFCNMAISFGAAKNDEEASRFIDKLADERRYLCDVWG